MGAGTRRGRRKQSALLRDNYQYTTELQPEHVAPYLGRSPVNELGFDPTPLVHTVEDAGLLFYVSAKDVHRLALGVPAEIVESSFATDLETTLWMKGFLHRQPWRITTAGSFRDEAASPLSSSNHVRTTFTSITSPIVRLIATEHHSGCLESRHVALTHLDSQPN